MFLSSLISPKKRNFNSLEALSSKWNEMRCVLVFQIEIEFECKFEFEERAKPEYLEENL